jgi:hypothetical protein
MPYGVLMAVWRQFTHNTQRSCPHVLFFVLGQLQNNLRVLARMTVISKVNSRAARVL